MNPADDHRDPDVDLAWRAANRETPPPALDAAITAAARRAVGAGPKSLHAPRAWWPVAAAAVVAVVAIGIVEMTPPEQVAPTLTPPAPQAPAPAEPAAPQDALRERAAAPAAVPQPVPSGSAERTRKVERASPPIRADAPPPVSDAPPAVSDASRQGAKPGVPFPASPSDSSPAMNAVAPPVDRLAAPAASPKARQEMPPSNAGASGQAPEPLAEDERKAPSGAAGALAARREPAAALAKRAQNSATMQEDAQPRTVDEWIRLIRRLKAEGRSDLAAKELAAFRARYRDRSEALLPSDLRDVKP